MILVTGAGGVLGQALVRLIDRRKIEAYILGSAELDLRDADATEWLFRRVRPSLVIHMAAKVHGLGGNSRFPAEVFTDNVRINTNVVDATQKAGCPRIVAVSTVATYASDLPRPVREDAIWDGPPHASEAAYGHAKRAMLAQLLAYRAQFGLSFAYPLMTNVYGPHDRFDVRHGHVIPSLIAKFHQAKMNGGGVTVWGTGRAERDFIHADDAAAAILLIAADFDGPINVATGQVCPIRDVVEILASYTETRDVNWDSNQPDGQLLRRYDTSKLEQLGFSPRVRLKTGVEQTFEWYASHYPNVRGVT